MRFLSIPSLLVLAGCGALSQNRPPAFDPVAVDRLAEAYRVEGGIAGLAVAISRQGRVVHRAGYGVARLDPLRQMTAETPLELFSVGKAATAVLALRLEEQGLLTLDAPAGRLVDGLPAEYASSTLRQLLRHSSGNLETLIDETSPQQRFLAAPTRQEILAWLGEGRGLAAPDATWVYKGWGFVVAALASETATGRSYPNLVRRELAAPLALTDFAYCPELDERRAGGYMRVDGELAPIPPIDFGWFGGAGSLCATVGDLSRWWMALRRGDLVGPSALAAMTAPVELVAGSATTELGYGLGVRLGDDGGRPMIGHTGNGAGGTAALVDHPQDDLLVVVVTNTAGDGVPHALGLATALARRLLGIEIAPQRPEPVPPAILAAAPGHYVSPEGSFCVTANAGTLLVATDGGAPVELSYQGDGRFRRRGRSDVEESFLGGEGKSEWFEYRWHGFPMDLARRAGDVCPR